MRSQWLAVVQAARVESHFSWERGGVQGGQNSQRVSVGLSFGPVTPSCLDNIEGVAARQLLQCQTGFWAQLEGVCDNGQDAKAGVRLSGSSASQWQNQQEDGEDARDD